MTKRDKVKHLDEIVLDAMIAAVEQDEPDKLPLYNTAIQYIKANEGTLEREKDTEEDANKKRVKEANERRKQKV